jgi:hypothetical protein
MATDKATFFDSFLQDIIDVRQRKGTVHIFPFILGTFFAVGGVAAYYFPWSFFSPEEWDSSATVYSGILAFNAITLALSWGAVGRVLEIMSNPGFSSFLQTHGMLNKYSFYVTFLHIIQVIAATCTLVALVMIFIALVPEWVNRVMLAVVIATTLYALRWSLGAVRIASDLIRQFAIFDGLDPKQKQALRVAVDNDRGYS